MVFVRKLFCCVIALIVVESCLAETYHFCPHEDKLSNYSKVDDEEINESGHFLGHVKKTVIIPKTSVLSQPIQCILVTDLTDDQSSGKVEVSGGVEFYNVRLEFTSEFGKGLKYRIEVYTSKPK